MAKLLRADVAPWLVGGVVLLLTLSATAFMSGLLAQRDQARFENALQSARDRVHDRMETYIAALRGVAALFAASQEVTAREFLDYVRRLEVQERYPAVQGVGFARRVVPQELPELTAELTQRLGRPVEVRPSGMRAEYYPTVYLEPLEERNQEAIGYDMYADSVRREAMIRARDTGRPALSGRVRLAQEFDPGTEQAGFLIYMPVYVGGATPGGEMRRAALRGFVYAPVRAAVLFEGIFGSERPRVAFRVYDGAAPDTSPLLHDSDPAATAAPEQHDFADTLRLDIGAHAWTLTFVSLPELEQGSGRRFLLPAFMILGIAMSGLLFVLTRAQVEARARAERSEAQRARFFAAMSHELRTPINAIIGYNDLLLGGVLGELPAKQLKGIERSQKSAQHLAELVNDVLDLSKLEAGKLTLEIEGVDMKHVVDDLLGTIRPLAEERGSEVVVDVTGCTNRVWTDPRRVRQILLNLLSNAAKFGNGKPIEVRCADRHNGIEVEVTDHGVGIPPEHLHSIFEEFVQLDGAGHGTGLGLPISRRLAEMLGGTLEVESAVGRGSTFRLQLPGEGPPRDG
jgi:signal transduction histidine kinase